MVPRWRCPLCGFETEDYEEKTRHLQQMKDDSVHKEMNRWEIETEKTKPEGVL